MIFYLRVHNKITGHSASNDMSNATQNSADELTQFVGMLVHKLAVTNRVKRLNVHFEILKF